MLHERRAYALNATALLIDQYRGPGAADAVTQARHQVADLLFLADIASEQYEAPWALARKEVAFFLRQREALAAGYECF